MQHQAQADVYDAQAMLEAAVTAARAAGFRIKWQIGQGDTTPVAIVDGGPEPAAGAPEPAPVAAAEDDD